MSKVNFNVSGYKGVGELLPGFLVTIDPELTLVLVQVRIDPKDPVVTEGAVKVLENGACQLRVEEVINFC